MSIQQVLLVTNKEETPAMFKALAYNMRVWGGCLALVLLCSVLLCIVMWLHVYGINPHHTCT